MLSVNVNGSWGALCLVVGVRHVGGVRSWGRHDRLPSDCVLELLVLDGYF